MKALSVRQPWASLIASGVKSIEVRSWTTAHRGDLLVCAALNPSTSADAKEASRRHGIDRLREPRGVALCVVELIDVRPLAPADADAACCPHQPGAYALVLGNVRRVEPFAVSGQLHLFNVADELIKVLEADAA